MTRDVAQRLHFAKPCLIHARFLDALQGPGSKMSASVDSSAIFMKDTPKQIANKINKFAFSGGQVTVEEHREKGGDTTKDVPYQYLTFFLEDDEDLEKTRVDYSEGRMLTGEIKAKCIEQLQVYVKEFQERRAKVTDEMVKEYMSQRKLEWKGNPKAPTVLPVRSAEGGAKEDGEKVGSGELTKNQLKKLAKQKEIEAKKAQKQKEKEEAQAAQA
jgi:tryptophanyl-tRNA synthetase